MNDRLKRIKDIRLIQWKIATLNREKAQQRHGGRLESAGIVIDLEQLELEAEIKYLQAENHLESISTPR